MSTNYKHFYTKTGILVAVEVGEVTDTNGRIKTINVRTNKTRKFKYSELESHVFTRKAKKPATPKRGYQKNSWGMNEMIVKQVGKLLSTLTEKYGKYGITFDHTKELSKDDIFNYLQDNYNVPRNQGFDENIKSKLKPDGGILWMNTKDGDRYPILISEMKSQGEGKKQAKGNAIERAGKNIIAIESLLSLELEITPMVIFAQGHDFAEGSSILGRASILNKMHPLNVVDISSTNLLVNGEGKNKRAPNKIDPLIRRFAFMARKDAWTDAEVYDVIERVSEQAIEYFLSR